MTIRLLQQVRINGAAQAIGSEWNLGASAEADLIRRGLAEWADDWTGTPSPIGADELRGGVRGIETLQYETVAAGVSNQALGAVGAIGDELRRLICVVATAATAQVQIKDGSGAAITVLPNSPAGGVGTYVIELGLQSVAGAWQITTGAGVSVIAAGLFS